MKLSHLNWSLLAAACFLCGEAVAHEQIKACPVKAKITEPTVFLIDKNNNIAKGPIDFGTYVTKEDFVSDYLVKDTEYRMVLFPSKLSIKTEQCNICLSVKKAAPLCPNSTTYDVGIGMVFRGKPGAVSPYKIDEAFNLQFNDPKLDYDPTVKTAFDTRIVGVLVKKK